MALTLSGESLPGVLVREAIGPRIIDTGAAEEKENDWLGIIRSIAWNSSKMLTGFAFKAVSFLLGGTINLQNLWGFIVNQTQYIVNFDFGATDEQLDAQVRGIWSTYVAQLAGGLGQALGWVLCGIAPGAVVFKFNAAAGARVLQEVGEEALDELAATVNILCQIGLRNLARTTFNRQFKAIRRWLKQPGNPFYAFLPQSLKDAWETGGSWTIAQQIEEAFESIPNQTIQNAAEELYEELVDTCIEAGYVVTGALDQFILEQKTKAAEQVLEVTPNREYPSEKFILAGPEDELRATLPSAIANYEILDQRDVGIVSTIDHTQLFTKSMPLELYCRIEWRSERGNEGPRPSYQISSVNRARIDDYDFIRQICGGANGYLWGRWKAIAQMSDGHTITSYAATEGLAESRVRDLAQLSEAEIQTVNVIHELKEDKRLLIQGLQRDSEIVRPHRLILTNRKYFSTPQFNSKASKRGYWIPLTARLSISSPNKPSDWDETIAEILRGPVGGVGDV